MDQHNINQYEKAEAIVKAVTNFQKAVLNLRPIDELDKIVSLQILFEMFKAEMFRILAAPMPKYPPGGPAIVGEKEVNEIFDYLNQPKKKTFQERFDEMQQKKKI